MTSVRNATLSPETLRPDFFPNPRQHSTLSTCQIARNGTWGTLFTSIDVWIPIHQLTAAHRSALPSFSQSLSSILIANLLRTSKMAPKLRVIYWFRTDLRLHDSPALKAALDLKPECLYPLWCWDPHYVYRARVGPNRWQYL